MGTPRLTSGRSVSMVAIAIGRAVSSEPPFISDRHASTICR
jgi:hypothetical protein